MSNERIKNGIIFQKTIKKCRMSDDIFYKYIFEGGF